MINPLIKNCRTGFHDDILNRTSHYKKLLSTKAKVDTQIDKIYMSSISKKTNKSHDEQTSQENLRIFRKLMAIQRKTPRYQTDSIETQSCPKKTLKNYYKQRQKSLMISQDNVRLLKRLQSIESDFSMKKLDAEHQQMLKKSRKNGQSYKKVGLIDDLYYKSFKMELFRDRLESKFDKFHSKTVKQSNKIKNRDRFKTLNPHQQLKIPKLD